MGNGGTITKEKIKSIVYDIIEIINFLSIVAIILVTLISKISIEFFVLISIIIFINSCIRPFINYKNEVLCEETEINSIHILQPCIVAAAGLGGIFIIYKIIFTQSIIQEKNYTAYNSLALCIFLYIMIIQIIAIIKKIKILIAEKSSFMRYVFNFVISIFSITSLAIIPINNFLVPKKVVNLSNIKMPSEFIIYEESGKKLEDRKSIFSSDRKIDDNKFVEALLKEIPKTKGENIRNLDRINYYIRYTGWESYIRIYPSYTMINGSYKPPGGIDKGYIYEIRIHKNGDVVLVDYDTGKNNILLKNQVDMYRVNLSNELVKRLISNIKWNI